jgi:hypothetical protein
MTRIEVCTYDLVTGCNQVDHTWDVAGMTPKDLKKTRKVADRWALSAAAEDPSSSHTVYVRNVT